MCALRLGTLLTLALVAPLQAAAQDCELGDTALEVDLDLDGFTPAQGDCADCDPSVYPGANENCNDEIDNNCDGFFNEGCDLSVAQGEVRGGGGCTDGGNLLAVTGLLSLGLMCGARRDEGVG